MSKLRHTVSQSALIRRVNRRLAHEGLKLRQCNPNSRWYRDLGPFYLNWQNNVVESWVDLEGKARDLEVMGRVEVLVD